MVQALGRQRSEVGPRRLGRLRYCACDAELEPMPSTERPFCIQGGSFVYINPLLNTSAAQSSMQVAVDFAVAQGGSGVIDALPSWYAFFTKYSVPADAVSALVRLCDCELTCLRALV